MAWPYPEDGQTFAEVLAELPLLERALNDHAQELVLQLLAEAPDWLLPEEKHRAAELIKCMLVEFPGATPTELLWTLGADAFRPRSRGRKPKWTGVEGANLFDLVEAGLKAMGLRRDGEKGLRRVIAEIRARLPELYGKYSEERLRKAYYEASRPQSGKSSN